MHGSRSKIPSKKSPNIYDISRLKVKWQVLLFETLVCFLRGTKSIAGRVRVFRRHAVVVVVTGLLKKWKSGIVTKRNSLQ
jgi:hypothetical protein